MTCIIIWNENTCLKISLYQNVVCLAYCIVAYNDIRVHIFTYISLHMHMDFHFVVNAAHLQSKCTW